MPPVPVQCISRNAVESCVKRTALSRACTACTISANTVLPTCPGSSERLRRTTKGVASDRSRVAALARLPISSASRAFLAEFPRPPRAAAALAAPRQKRSQDEGRFCSPSQKLVCVEKALAVAVQRGACCGFPQTIYLGLHALRVGGAPVAGAVVAGAAAACRGGADHRGHRAPRKRGGQ